MFANLYKFVLAATFVANAARATPILPPMDVVARGLVSFDNYDGLSSFSGFDNFYGEDNFSGLISSQTFVEQSEELVCHSVSVEIVQQRLLVLQEMAKRQVHMILTEQICEVETQVVAFEQFYSSLGNFHDDLLRKSHLRVGFDTEIASHFSDIVSSDGSLSTNDFGFSGQDLGQNTVVVGGSNWDDASSPSSVGSAYTAALQASRGSLGLYSASLSLPASSTPTDDSDSSTDSEDNSAVAASSATSDAAPAAPDAGAGTPSRRAWWQARDSAEWWQARDNARKARDSASWWQARDRASWWRRSPLKWY